MQNRDSSETKPLRDADEAREKAHAQIGQRIGEKRCQPARKLKTVRKPSELR
jgi:hypothetical protein